jgi:hypothetical protein
VEEITPYRTRPSTRGTSPIPKLPPFLRLVFLILSGFSIANIGVMAMGQYALPPSNPFTAFADIFPGQLRNAIEAHDFSCIDQDYYSHTPEEHCFFQP